MILGEEQGPTELVRRIVAGTELLIESNLHKAIGLRRVAFETLTEAIRIAEATDLEEQDEEIAAVGYHNRGIIHCLNGEHESALEDFTSAIALTIAPAASRYAHAQALISLDDAEGALDEITRVIDDPKGLSYLPDALYIRGFIKSELGDLEGALEDIKHAQQNGLDHVDAVMTVAKCYAMQGHWNLAEETIKAFERREEIRGLNGHDAGFLILYNKALILMGKGDFGEALGLFAKVPAQGNERFLELTKAACLYRMGSTQQAETSIAQLDLTAEELHYIRSDEVLTPIDSIEEDYRPRVLGDNRLFKGDQN